MVVRVEIEIKCVSDTVGFVGYDDRRRCVRETGRVRRNATQPRGMRPHIILRGQIDIATERADAAEINRVRNIVVVLLRRNVGQVVCDICRPVLFLRVQVR